MTKTLSLLFLLIAFSGHSQRFSFIETLIDTSDLGLTNQLRLTVVLTKRNGKELVINSESPGSKWKKVHISGNDLLMSANSGIVYFNQRDVHAGNRLLEITVAVEGSALYAKQSIRLPYVTQLFIDSHSFVINEPQLLPYRMLFSNGKMCPSSPKLFTLKNIRSESNLTLNEDGEFCYRAIQPTAERITQLKLIDSRSGEILFNQPMELKYATSLSFVRNGITGSTGWSGTSVSGTSSDGNHGSSGGTGSNAPDFDIYIRQTVQDRDTILSFHMLGRTVDEFHFVQFVRDTIFICARGGNGGDGGDGSPGYAGDINKEKDINSPYGGSGGNGGQGGSGGDGGIVSLFFSPETTYLRSFIVVDTQAGRGGNGGFGGDGGRGDYSDSGLLGILFNAKDGSNGRRGSSGPSGRPGHVSETYLQTQQAWEELYEIAKHRW